MGATNALPGGAVSAIKALRHRVPESASPEAAALADRAFRRIVDVMEGNVSADMAFSVLSAGKTVREEICGPVPKKLEHSGPDGAPISISINLGGEK